MIFKYRAKLTPVAVNCLPEMIFTIADFDHNLENRNYHRSTHYRERLANFESFASHFRLDFQFPVVRYWHVVYLLFLLELQDHHH